MKFKVENGVVTIECSVLEGKVLMQGANLMGHDLDNVEEQVVEQHVKDFGAASVEELMTAVEECYTTLPHEDDEAWTK